MFEGTVKGTILGGAGGGLGAATNEDNLRGGFGDWAAGVGKGIGGGMFTGGVTGLTGGAMDEYIGTKVDTSSLSGTITKTAAAGATSELTGAVINGSTWEGSGDDIAKRLLGSTLKGGYSGAVGGFGEHRKDKLEAQAEAAKAAAATPAVDAPAVDAPVIAPAVTPAVDVPAVQTPQVTAPSVQTEAQLLDRLIRFENAGGSRALVDFGLGMMNDPVALEQLLSSHGG